MEITIEKDLYLRLLSERGILNEIERIVQTTKGTDQTLKAITEILDTYKTLKAKK